ncbi:MAG: tRNA epoxyqueuosine(34) reductase QueG [Verrucomicrobia subdivision 3 bacterium]|nr:tRNA epoxyqueuosine(34) reductase QueG [Limisphaerales bacterium]
MKAQIQQRARELGFDDCRVTTARPPDHSAHFKRWLDSRYHGEMAYLERNAHQRLDPGQVLSGVRSIISLAASYHIARQESGPVARYARFTDYHDVLGERLKDLSELTCQLGGPDVRSLWYVDTGPILERDIAQRAGIGFVGKHTNLISRKLGNWIFLGQIITTIELEPDAPEPNRCGACVRCIEACPTAAIRAPFDLDARRCISYLTIELKGAIPEELRPAVGTRIFGCDDCLAVCPWNRFAREGRLMKARSRDDLAAPDLIELLSLDDTAFRKRFEGTPILRAKRRGLLRNVCVALGNLGDSVALAALERAARDPEPLIAEHARWAVSRIVASQPRSAVVHLAQVKKLAG